MPWDPPTLLAGETVTPLVSTQAYCDWYGLGTYDQLDTATQTRIEMALDIASSDIRSETQQLLSQASETITLYPPYGHCVAQFTLPQWPVTAITALSVGGNTLTADTDYVWEQAGVVTFISPSWWSYIYPVSVTYTHGWNPIPGDIAGVTLARAKRVYDNPDAQAIQKESLGDWSVAYTSVGGGLTPDECDRLRRYAAWTPAS